MAVGQATQQRIGGIEPAARQSEMEPELTRRTGQQERAADIGHETDAGFGHGQDGALCDEPVRRMGTEADAAAHGHAVHRAHDRLGKSGQTGVETILGAKEIRNRRPLSGPGGLVERADIAAGAKGAVSGAVDQHGRDLRIDLPAVERRIDDTNHGERQGIIGFGAVEREVAEPSLATRHHVGSGKRLRRSRRGVAHSDGLRHRWLGRSLDARLRGDSSAPPAPGGSPTKMPFGRLRVDGHAGRGG